MLEKLRPVAERMREAERKLLERADAVRKAGAAIPESPEAAPAYPVPRQPLDISVAAVDAGLLADRVHGSDLAIGRAVAVNFVYRGSELASCEHHPQKFPEPEIEVRDGLDEHGALVFRQLFRLRLEIGAAISAVERFKPDLLLLDGSVVPLGSDRPAPDSPLHGEYTALIESYKKLFSLCAGKGCRPVGVVKDSRGRRLAELLGGIEVADTVFAGFLLKEGERTAAMPYASPKRRTPVLKDLGEYGGRVSVFYLRPSEHDLPLRVEFLDPGGGTRDTGHATPGTERDAGVPGARDAGRGVAGADVDEIASLVHSLSSISKSFAYPAVLIEADLCAALDPLEMENVKNSLFALSGSAARPLRRNARPFR